MYNYLIPNCDVHLKIGDTVYKLFYDDVTFHIEKTKIINIEKRTHKPHSYLSLEMTDTYFICEDGYEFELGDIDQNIYAYKKCYLFSSLDKLKKCVKQEIEESIYSTRMLIEKYQHRLNVLKNRHKLYENC